MMLEKYMGGHLKVSRQNSRVASSQVEKGRGSFPCEWNQTAEKVDISTIVKSLCVLLLVIEVLCSG